MKKQIALLLMAVLFLALITCDRTTVESTYAPQKDPTVCTQPQLAQPAAADTQTGQPAADTPIAGGSCSESIIWTLTGDGTLTLSGTGPITDYEKGAGNQPWQKHRNSITALIIGDGITRVGDRAFQGCSNLTHAVFGKDVAAVGQWAFQNCYQLTDVDLPPHVTLETGAFRSTAVEWEVSEIGSELYAGSNYYSALSQVALTGDYREDIINIALSQVGYHEGNSDADYAGNNTSGSKDYTEYGRRLGSAGSAWCSEFASWCIRMAGVPTDRIACSRAANITSFTQNTSATWCLWRDTAYHSGGYIPRKGDLLLWSWDNGSYGTEDNLSHTSILWDIETQENGSVVIMKTIDGNSNNQVSVCSYRINAADGTLIGRKGMLCYIISPDYEGIRE